MKLPLSLPQPHLPRSIIPLINQPHPNIIIIIILRPHLHQHLPKGNIDPPAIILILPRPFRNICSQFACVAPFISTISPLPSCSLKGLASSACLLPSSLSFCRGLCFIRKSRLATSESDAIAGWGPRKHS
jgi:hypothetical protein